jgi:hypothetical protein
MRLYSSVLITLVFFYSCSKNDELANTVYKTEYKRHIIYKDSIANYEGDGTIRVLKKDNFYSFNFEVENGKVESLMDIEMEMTGGNTLRNVDWTPSKLIMMTKDSLNIAYQIHQQKWFVGGKSIINK